MITKYLIIDGNYMVNRMVRSGNFDEMFTDKGDFVGGCFGVLNSMRKDISLFNPQKVIFVFDKGHSKRRLGIYSEYKNHFGDKSEEDRQLYKIIYDQCDKMKEILVSLGVHCVELDGKEGDDICFNITWYYEGNKVLVSDDKDYILMLAEDTALYRPIADEFITHKNCKDIVGYTPAEYLFYKIINGDGSDNIKGVDRVGEKTIRGLLDKIETPVVEEVLENTVYKILEVMSTMELNNREKLILERLDIVYRNLRLIDISKEEFSTEETSSLTTSIDKVIKLNISRFNEVCKKYQFESILSTLDSWVRPFEQLR